MGGFVVATICVVLMHVVLTDAACTFPANLNGVFEDSLKGKLTFDSTNVTVSGYTLHTFATFDLKCFYSAGNQYVFKSTSVFVYYGLTWDSYFCWDITEVSANAFLMYEISTVTPDAGNERVKIYLSNKAYSIPAICAETSVVTGTYRFLMKQGAISSVKITCPSQFNTYASYTLKKNDVSYCINDTQYNGCTDTTAMTYNYNLCSDTLAYTSGGSVYCVHTMGSASKMFLTTYNRDNATDEVNTFRYTCHILDLSTSGLVYSTQYPRQCQDNQTSTYATAPGNVVVYKDTTTCVTPPTVGSASVGWMIAVGVVLGLLLILVVVLVALCYYAYRKDMKARERKIIDIRAAEDADPRAQEDTEERGKAAPHLRIRFPDYTRRKGDTRWRKDLDAENDRPLTPTGIHFQTKTDRDSPDSAFGSIDDDDELAILRKPKPVSDFMKRLISLHDQKKVAAKEKAKVSTDVHFRKQQGRQGFKTEDELISSYGPSLLTKIKSMARNRKRKTADIYQSEAAVKVAANKEVEDASDEPDVGLDHDYVERLERETDSVEGEYPAELNVHRLLAYTALAPAATDLKRGSEARKSKNKGVTISERQNEEIIVEDLEDNVSRKHAGGFVSDSSEFPESRDRSKVYAIQSHEVTPNMKIRTHGRLDDDEDSVSHRDNVLQRIHKKPKYAFDLPDIDKAELLNPDSDLRRRLGEDRWRRLLEELYPDKKYMDYAQDTSRPTEEFLFKKAAQGLNYLYNRAEFWDKQEPITRPQTTARCYRAKSSRSVRKSRVSSAGVTRHKSLSAKQYAKENV